MLYLEGKNTVSGQTALNILQCRINYSKYSRVLYRGKGSIRSMYKGYKSMFVVDGDSVEGSDVSLCHLTLHGTHKYMDNRSNILSIVWPVF